MERRKAVMAKASKRGKSAGRELGWVISKEFMVLVEGDKLSELKLNVPGLIYYFGRRYAEIKGAWYPISTIVWTKDGAELKRAILDNMVMNGMTVEDMKEFVDWVFKNKPEVKWTISFLRPFYTDWYGVKTKGNGRRFAEARAQAESSEETQAARRLEEKQFIEYVGEGYFDHRLTKRQYALGLNWRVRNQTPEMRTRIRSKNASDHPAADTARLTRWREEIEAAEMTAPIAYQRLFVVELARYKRMSVAEALTYFYRDELRPLFTAEELAMKGLDGIEFTI